MKSPLKPKPVSPAQSNQKPPTKPVKKSPATTVILNPIQCTAFNKLVRPERRPILIIQFSSAIEMSQTMFDRLTKEMDEGARYKMSAEDDNLFVRRWTGLKTFINALRREEAALKEKEKEKDEVEGGK